MATTAEINAILIDTALAYPAYDKARLTLAMKHYVKALAGYEAGMIKAAAEQVITENKWFPSVAEFVEACRRVEINNKPNQIARVMRKDDLRELAFELEDNRAAGQFIPEQWEELAQRFDQAGRSEAANHLRWKAGLVFTFAPYEVEVGA